MVDKSKRNFFKQASKIINNKLCIETQLKSYCNFENMKMLILNEEQIEILRKTPYLKFEQYLYI